MTEPISPLNFERFELKYIIPVELIPAIQEFIKPYCEMDPYSAREEDHFYRINSLYLDTPLSLFYRKRKLNEAKRFNMRIRHYGDKPGNLFFYEIKLKEYGFVKKYRAKSNTDKWWHDISSKLEGDAQSKNLNLFLNTAFKYQIEPKVYTTYKRMAYASHVDEYARITFDKNLSFCGCDHYLSETDNIEYIPYDYHSLFKDQGEIILELKSYSSVPMWMLDLIEVFDLNRTSFSKYCNSYESHYENELYGIDPISQTDLQSRVPIFI